MKKKNHVFAKKKFGQNFLHDKNIIEKIVTLFDIKQQNIVEIGPGRGALTSELVKKAKQVIAFEIDKDMVDVLNQNINSNNLDLRHQDFLKSDLSNLPTSIVIANIPYYITTDILFKIFEHRDKFSKTILMVQKEVAQRLIAKYKTYDYSKLTVSAQYLAKVNLEFVVPASCFIPAPKVDSAIVSFEFYPNISNQYWLRLKGFFKVCFANRRKKLIFSLKLKYSLEKINAAYQKLHLNENTRIQELKISEIINLYQELEK